MTDQACDCHGHVFTGSAIASRPSTLMPRRGCRSCWFIRLSPPPSVAGLIDVFRAWTPDRDIQRQILVDNPARLYGFGA